MVSVRQDLKADVSSQKCEIWPGQDTVRPLVGVTSVGGVERTPVQLTPVSNSFTTMVRHGWTYNTCRALTMCYIPAKKLINQRVNSSEENSLLLMIFDKDFSIFWVDSRKNSA